MASPPTATASEGSCLPQPGPPGVIVGSAVGGGVAVAVGLGEGVAELAVGEGVLPPHPASNKSSRLAHKKGNRRMTSAPTLLEGESSSCCRPIALDADADAQRSVDCFGECWHHA